MDLIPDFDLSHRNTLGLPSIARFGAMLDDAAHLNGLVAKTRDHNLPLQVIGGGSNVVLKARIEAVVVLMRLMGRTVSGETPTHVLVTAGAGEAWHNFVTWTLENKLPGLENLAGIPGTVGAAPIQNIGAYGVQVSDLFHSLEAFDVADGTVRTFDRDACAFAYRNSVFKAHPRRFVVLSVSFALPRNWHARTDYPGLEVLGTEAAPETVMEHVVQLRRSKLPDWKQLGNAGSFFHNPIVSAEQAAALTGAPCHMQPDGRVKLSAGWLIEQCGLKGYRLGPVGIYDRHALVFVNHGGATHEDVENLSALVRERVKARFGVDLAQEPIVL